jgi:GNAT superfamily N-acetyltransferase
MAIQFVRATNRDLDTIHRLVDAALREHEGLRLLLSSSDFDLTDIELNYHQRGGSFELLVGPDSGVVGVLGWRPAGDAVVELKKLYLAFSARGQGLGRLALERVVVAARALGSRAVVLETSAALKPANRLYTRFGFVPVKGEAAVSFACLSEQCDLAYRLDLEPPLP